MSDGTQRSHIQPGVKVRIVEKQNQLTGRLTEGVVKDILTKSVFHPRGIKVRLETGIIGRVREVIKPPCPESGEHSPSPPPGY
ncbi:MAG: YwbE family protein [Peptococcaceae bacterium]|jgi:uncharacterized repeat protein (TIGR03833 family)|nr:YwbE family protein [Peptococcaceae bacterium]